jgi:hypothetical protein
MAYAALAKSPVNSSSYVVDAVNAEMETASAEKLDPLGLGITLSTKVYHKYDVKPSKLPKVTYRPRLRSSLVYVSSPSSSAFVSLTRCASSSEIQ